MVGWSITKVLPCGEKECLSAVTGSITLKEPQLWWPWDMSSNPAYLYIFQVRPLATIGIHFFFFVFLNLFISVSIGIQSLS